MKHGVRQRSVLLQRGYGLFWGASLLATSGMWLWRITSPIVMFEMTGSPYMLGLLSLASYGPILAVSFFGGVLADRYSPRVMVVSAQSTTALLFVGLAVVGWTSGLTPTAVFVVAVLEGTAYAIAKPSLQSLLYQIVEPADLSRAVAVNGTQFTLAQLIGPLIATTLHFVGGPSLALAAASLLYVPLVVGMFRIPARTGYVRGIVEERGVAMLRGGLRAVRSRAAAHLLLIVAAGSIAMEGAIRVLAPQFATAALGQSERAAGLIVSSQALGGTLSVVVLGFAVRRWRDLSIARAGYVIMAVAILVYAAAPSMAIALPLAVLVGISYTLSFSIATAQIHHVTADAVRGRVMAVHAMALLGTRPLAGLVAGTVSGMAGPRLASGAFAALALLGVLLVTRLSSTAERTGSGDAAGLLAGEPA